MFLGEAAIYIVGVPWFALSLHVSFSSALSLGFTPFLLGDTIKAGLSGLALPTSRRLIERVTRR
jgi:biotin transport system substrate-specific component